MIDNYKRIWIGNEVGTLTCFLEIGEGQIVGLSAFHVLTGGNKAIDLEEDIIKVFDYETQQWCNFGKIIDGKYNAGMGTSDNFGKLDFAIFELTDELNLKINNYLQLRTESDENEITIGSKVRGFSSDSQYYLEGKIEAIKYQTNTGKRYDLRIKLDDGYHTNKGDSGMLWLDVNDNPIAMHTNGNRKFKATISYSTFLSRVTKKTDSNVLVYAKTLV